ncbi:hypothetical protein OEZ85_002549 [Tetradesmus obliquus]|uniref:Ankyrin repeat protein n=1 Tax=Tetradesmus obliquus TaxID=3088 RepID=A0ABY8U0I2_TETOB|nr:hypothetical protein OEZ85_002549 [Tetradesmus obliquus]
MGNAQTRESGFISAGANGDTSYVRQAMQTDTTARERLLSAHTGFFSGKKTILHVAAKTGKADVVASVLGPLVDAVTAEIVDGVYPGKAAELLGRTVNQQVCSTGVGR